MKNRFLVCGIIIGMLFTGSVNADNTQYGTSQLQLNTQIIDTMNSATRQSSEYYQNKNAQTSKVQSPIKSNAVTKKESIQNISYSKSNIGTKNLADKDLQIEGRIEKTQKESLYQNQSPAELQAMVDRIGKKIIKANNITTSITFKYDPGDVANANTNFSGKIRVYKGLIKYCEDEDELAYVIGHEIGHAVSHHVAKGVAMGVGGAVASTAASIAVEHATKSVWAGLGVGAATDVLVGLGQNKASRVMETNADLLSMDYVVKAGYNPLASIAIMNKIGENYVDFWADHPSTDKRIVMMYDYIKKKYPQYLANGYDSYFYDKALDDYIYNTAYYQKLSKDKNQKALKKN